MYTPGLQPIQGHSWMFFILPLFLRWEPNKHESNVLSVGATTLTKYYCEFLTIKECDNISFRKGEGDKDCCP